MEIVQGRRVSVCCIGLYGKKVWLLGVVSELRCLLSYVQGENKCERCFPIISTDWLFFLP